MGNYVSTLSHRLNYKISNDIVTLILHCKICGFLLCVVGTIIYVFLPLSVDFTPTALLVPAFIPGYIIVNAVGVIENFSNRHDVIADIWFNTLGTCANLYCLIDLTRDWILWLIKKYDSSAPNYYGLEYFLLILTLGLNIATMIIQLVFILRRVEHARSRR